MPLDINHNTPDGIRRVELGLLSPNPAQPRKHFDEASLEELAQSIKSRGVLQPIIVRTHGPGFQIIAGERRWRAAQRAGLHQVPVIIKALDDATTLEIALVENIQRQDLNAIEEADSYRRLIAEFGHTQEALGVLVHKSRSHIANLLRLLDLPKPVRDAVVDNRLSMGHARALLSASDPEILMAEVIARNLSVRDTEALVRSKRVVQRPLLDRSAHRANPDLEALEHHIGALLGLRVKIAHGPKGGTLTLNYASLDQLDLICQRLSDGSF
ncbi:MAG: ParB/RepB/Spo0J family partition protein [Alphaproteobacteria bacterium]|nr:ParB/RepB/Spo0J family partition protein [Alphaproteobacteria bacterium]